ncbi:MAG TPA: threonine/serine exporter family protein [Acetivibrio clariflavus]|nr:threonine/serine exporter family protein [Acetivibrio clariflavus]
MKINQVMDIAIKAGKILLANGSEIYRVEDTIGRICRSYGVEVECFVLPTSIFITVIGKDGEPLSVVKRISERTVDLSCVEKVNSFSRRIQESPIPYEEAMETLEKIEREKGYKFGLRLFVAGVTAFVYTLLFKGTVQDAVVAFIIGMLIYISKEKVSRIGVFKFFEYFVSGLIAAGMSVIAVKIFPFLNIYRIIISSIMILLPGVSTTNALKDALHGDIVSSQFGMAEAIFTVVSVTAGVAIVLSLGLGWI